MKNQIIKWLFAVAALLTIASCDVNDYNEEHLDGFDPNPGITDVQTLTLTLEKADYKGIASDKTNQGIAKAAGLEKELKALEAQQYFTDKITVKEYLPAYLASKYSSYLSNGSKIKVVYNNFIGAPEQLAVIAAAKSYELKAADYALAWGGEITANYFTPAKPAASYLPRILKSAITTAQAGDYYVAEYEYSDQEPSTGEEPAVTITKIKDVIAVGEYTVQGKVMALYEQGLMVGDDTGNILVFTKTPSNYSLGESITVKATASLYNSYWQLATPEITYDAKASSFAFPTSPVVFDATTAEAFLNGTDRAVKYISITGTLEVTADKNGFPVYEVALDGSAIKVRLTYANAGLVDVALDGKKVTSTGYIIGTYKTTSINIMATTLVEQGQVNPYTPVGIVLTSAAGTYSSRGVVTVTTTQGFMLNDGTGALYVYTKNAPTVTKGQVVVVSGTTKLSNGMIQYNEPATVTATGTDAKEVKYPNAMEFTAEDMDAFVKTQFIRYVSYVGTLNIAVSGSFTNYNVIVDGAVTAQGSIYRPDPATIPDALNGKKVLITGYVTSLSGGKYVNTIITDPITEATAAAAAAYAATRGVATKQRLALYTFDGTAWKTNAESTIVNPEDYTQMGLSASNFSSSANPDKYLPSFLRLKFPYAQADEVKDVAYYFNDGKATVLRADQYMFDGMEWIKKSDVKVENAPFELLDGKWSFNPSITIVIYPVKANALAAIYYQAGCNYVTETKSEKYRFNGTGKDGEYYSGCSAFYGNLSWKYDLGSTSSPIYYWKLAGEDISLYDADKDPKHHAYWKELEKRFGEVMSAGLGVVHADADTINGIEITYTLRLGAYTGTTLGATEVTHDFTFRLIGKGKFEYIGMTPIDPKYDLFAE